MMSAWDRFEEALDRRDVAELCAVEESLDQETLGTPLDRQELRAVIWAVLASESEVALTVAKDAAARAAGAGRGDWPYYYLAEAASRVGDPESVLGAITHIDPTFFADRDLRWRQARCQELQAVANVRLGRWDAVHALTEELMADYVVHGDTDDYASPRELVGALLDAGAPGRELLGYVTSSIEAGEWLDQDRQARVDEAMSQR